MAEVVAHVFAHLTPSVSYIPLVNYCNAESEDPLPFHAIMETRTAIINTCTAVNFDVYLI